MTLVGLISDTHGLLRPQAAAVLAGVDHIIHAGDVGKREILDALREIAPLTAVRGNVDAGALGEILPDDAIVSFDGHDVYVLHNLDDAAIGMRGVRASAVISGHTHKPLVENCGGVFYINPGSAGPRRFSLPISVGFLRLVAGKAPEVWLTALDV
jgi:putative phosphoesterase